MIFGDEGPHSAVLDACVLVPMSLCDTLLRFAEEPALYRPLWSEPILKEMARALRTKLSRSVAEIAYRKERMNEAFPEAMVTFPADLIRAAECIPDVNDRHVLAAAIMAGADAIITQNIRHFPKTCIAKYGVESLTADDFMVRQYHHHCPLVLDKLDDQAAGIGRKRADVVESLKAAAPEFCKLVMQHL